MGSTQSEHDFSNDGNKLVTSLLEKDENKDKNDGASSLDKDENDGASSLDKFNILCNVAGIRLKLDFPDHNDK